MQTKSKILSILFIVVIYSLGYIVSSCVDPISQKRAYWKSYLDSLDKSCPITLDNAISINGEVVNDETKVISKDMALEGKIIIFRRGKKKYYIGLI